MNCFKQTKRHEPRLRIVTFAIGLMLSGLLLMPVRGQVVPEAEPSFAARAGGRAALIDSRYALATAPRVSISAKWFLLTTDTNKAAQTQTGTETLAFDRAHNYLRLLSTSATEENDSVAAIRAICDGGTLQVNYSRTRTFFRIPLQGDVSSATDALIAAAPEDSPFTDAIRTPLFALRNGEGLSIRGNVYQSRDKSIIEQLPRDENDQRLINTVRRYRLAAVSHFPTEIEEWITYRDKGNNTVRTTYLHQEFTYTPLVSLQKEQVHSQTPSGYKETPPPSGVSLPLRPGPDHADDKARALLRRWKHSWARFTSFKARIHVSEYAKAQTPESPRPSGEGDREAIMDVQYLRPGKLYVYSEPYGKPSAFTEKQTLISDGKTIAVYIGARQETKRGEQAAPMDDTVLDGPIRGAGFHDFSEALPHILEDPQNMLDSAEQVTYRGPLPLPQGGTAEAITMIQSFTDNGARRVGRATGPVTSQQTITLYFDTKTGLPLRIEFVLHRMNDKVEARDLPPDEYRTADFTEVRLNDASSASHFMIPKTP